MTYKASMAFAARGSKLVKALTDAGIVPAECSRFELVLDTKEPVRAKCEFNVTSDQMEVIVAALKQEHEDGKRVILDAVLKKMPASGDYQLGGKVFVDADGVLQEIDVRRRFDAEP
jgi:hypothetical protein